MQKAITLSLAILTVLTPVGFSAPFIGVLPTQAAENLILNADLEISAGSEPSNWHSNSWGTNTASFTYPVAGQSGNGAKVELSAITDGDAKWYFDDVVVADGQTYVFSDAYTSDVTTRVVARFTFPGGAVQYDDWGAVPAAETWQTYSRTFSVPTDVVSLTVFHLIDQVGVLTIDNARLEVSPLPPTLVPNPSLEEVSADPNLPVQWSPSKWGENTAIYEYMNSGHTGSRSIKVTVSDHISGDAKWVFDSEDLTPNQDYRFSAWYRTNATPRVVVEYIKPDGSEAFMGLPDPQPDGSANWQHYSDVFTVPGDAQSVTVFFFLRGNGWVQTDDYLIEPYEYPAFDRPIVTITFDDGFEGNVNTALPVMNQYGLKSTQCFMSGAVEGNQTAMDGVMAFFNSGHEICSHSVTHPFLTQKSPASLSYELSHSKEFLESLIGQPVKNFASPYGDYNASVNSQIAQYYQAHRTVDEGFNARDNFNPYRLRAQNMQLNTSLTQFQEWVNKATADKTWLILVYHRVTDADHEQFDTLEADFQAQMQWLASTGVSVQRWDTAMAEVQAQLQ